MIFRGHSEGRPAPPLFPFVYGHGINTEQVGHVLLKAVQGPTPFFSYGRLCLEFFRILLP